MPGRPKLNVRQQRFVDGIIAGKTPLEAYRLAGYTAQGHTAESSASEIRNHPEVAAEIDRRLGKVAEAVEKRAGVTVASIVERLDQVANRCLQAVPVMEFDRVRRRMVQKTEINEDGEEVGVFQFDSGGACRSLELLGKHLRMFGSDQPQVVNQTFVVVAPPAAESPEKWAELVAEKLEAPQPESAA